MSLSIKLSENGGRAPEAVPYMPPGRSVITATVNGVPGERTVWVDKSTAERLQADLVEHLSAAAAGRRARPLIMFDHRAGAAAAVPVGFEWDDQRGVLLRVEWTAAGRAAVEGGDYGYISPAFRCERDTGLVAGLGKSTVEVGSLVNDPAFERNECIVAARAELTDGGAEDDGFDEVVAARFLPPRAALAENYIRQHNIQDAAGANPEAAINNTEKETTRQMDTNALAQIAGLLGLPPEASAEEVCSAISALKGKADEGAAKLEQVQAESEKHLAALNQHKEDAADAFIKRQQDAGVIAPKDEERLKAARRLYMQDPKGTEQIFAGMRRADRFVLTDEDEVQAGKVQPSEAANMTLEEMLEAGM